jgi:hypothetical protein
MNHQNLLREFEYSVVAPKRPGEIQRRELFLKIDFASSKFYLKGNWQSIINASDEFDRVIYSLRTGDVEIGMKIFPTGVINLQDTNTDGLILFLKGAIQNENRVSPCTGMLVFTHAHSQIENEWFLQYYLYEPCSGYTEIRFRFPISQDREKVPRNFRYS